jgi:hypothetical protein
VVKKSEVTDIYIYIYIYIYACKYVCMTHTLSLCLTHTHTHTHTHSLSMEDNFCFKPLFLHGIFVLSSTMADLPAAGDAVTFCGRSCNDIYHK